MAEIVGCMAMSHAPQLLMPSDNWPDLPARTKGPFQPKPGIEAELTLDAMRAHAERCNAAIGALRERLAQWAPDTIVIMGDDQEENILKDNMPPFTIFIEDEVDATVKFRYFGEKETDQMTRYRVNGPLANELLGGLMGEGFDPAWSRETRYHAGLGHAFGRVLNFLTPEAERAIVPIMLNTYYPPAPSAKRCFDFGAALGHLIASSDNAERVVLIASGGLSHTKIDEKLDQDFIAALATRDGKYLSGMPDDVLVEGTSEIRNWIAIAGAAGSGGTMIDYVPCYRNADGVGCAMGFAYWDEKAA
jgi:3-O-methylgallate 3,4-dioxygenase